jgi:hypothetical protein
MEVQRFEGRIARANYLSFRSGRSPHKADPGVSII